MGRRKADELYNFKFPLSDANRRDDHGTWILPSLGFVWSQSPNPDLAATVGLSRHQRAANTAKARKSPGDADTPGGLIHENGPALSQHHSSLHSSPGILFTHHLPAKNFRSVPLANSRHSMLLVSALTARIVPWRSAIFRYYYHRQTCLLVLEHVNTNPSESTGCWNLNQCVAQQTLRKHMRSLPQPVVWNITSLFQWMTYIKRSQVENNYYCLYYWYIHVEL